ncbi:helicase and polymerase-containing protein TEBICHI isoform X4 [Durio zibethinus]|uniref:Helicase and polymerase-containing protein TEBICHI isoform X4 n=1 Tax=Durio zibethinus TaxID=66656 RepID=A0A6P5ZP20_DURZI|nr:helicase and polymerase-containing protein TEBICHI isoform X4 [Durio zibethinus]
MAFGTSRARIDQFFASKKRKPQSPGLKTGRFEKNAKTTVEGSPSAKGTLDNYLKASQDNEIMDPSCMTRGKDPVKRNLASEIDISSKDEKEQSLLLKEPKSQSSEEFEVTRKGKSLGSSEEGNVAFGDPAESALHVSENSELKQFATDFLSLYCSEVQPHVNSLSEMKVNDQRRHSGPSMMSEEDKRFKKRHLLSHQLQTEVVTVCSNKKNLEYEAGEFPWNPSQEVNTASNLIELQASLRKCTAATKSVLNRIECSTPGSSIVKACAHRTPQSMRGSSMFSPGEAFWNEAIEMADGLFFESDILSAQVAEETNNPKSQYEVKNTESLGNKNVGNKTKEIPDECESRVKLKGIRASWDSAMNQKKDIDKEVSLLPVKHLDFSFEEKNLDGSIPYIIQRDNEVTGCCVVNHKGPSTVNTLIDCDELKTNEEVQGEKLERASVHVVSKMEVSLSSQVNDSIISTSPANEVKKSSSDDECSETTTPLSSVVLKDQLSLSRWLPLEICEIYKKRGIAELYPWQVDCLQVDGVLQRRNLVYCASTSAGKSFVAEILMLRRVILTGKVALLVLPYVSICAEKAEHLEVLLEPLGRQVRSYYGNQGGGTLPKDTSVAVCTIEKANSLINRLLEEGRLPEIGIIVIDELHMVGDQSRGYLLELLLTKLRYAAGLGMSESISGESSGSSSSKADPGHGLQIVGMSATMPNVEAVADWLQAALYQTDFRPVPLEEFIKVGNTIYDKNMDIVRTIPKAVDLGGKDPDHIVELCNEVVQEGHSVLIFCSTRKGCESTATHVSKFLKKFSVNVNGDNSEFVDITSAINALRRSPAGLDPILEENLPSGVAYHHAGLTVEEREIIETCYRRGFVRVLTATSTLAAGVNLPARRVIFRQPRIGRDFIDGTRYKQMAGRAGRTGIDTKGESVLICKPEEIKRIKGLLNESCPPLQSCLSEDKNGMTHAILEVVAGGMVQTASDINRYVRCTLLNSTKPFQDVVKSAQDSLRWLCHKKFLEWNDETKLYGTTPLGRAAFGSSLCPEESLIVLDDLSRAREGFVLASDLHLVYLVTPINVEVEPDWELYYERFMELSALEQSVGYRVGVAEPFLMRMAHGAPIRKSNGLRDSMKRLRGKFENQLGINNTFLSDEQSHRVCKRFYVALMLSRLVQEAPVGEVCEAFRVAKGMVQALQENAGRFASMVSVFCERLGWHDLEGLVAKFQNRVSFGVRAEIVELTTIPYVKGSRARALYKAGLRTPLAVAEASIPEIVKALFESSSWVAQESLAQRRMQLGVAKKIKNGARKIVLDKAEEARAAAFSAFKSLGYSVPQFSRPLILNGSLGGQEAATTSVGDDFPSIVVGVEHIRHALSKPLTETSKNLEKVSSANEGIMLTKASADNLLASAEVKSDTTLQSNLCMENPVTGDEVNAAVECCRSIKMATISGYLDQGVQDRHNEDLCVGNVESACGKGPLNAVNTPGGFDSFLELWETALEFCFDIHFNRRSEPNSVAPFEIHGIAICWENSPVYYVNLPKDLLWLDNGKNNFLSTCASSDKHNSLPPEHFLEMAKLRWKRIGDIMGKSGVRKVTWNLKVQIQVLKSPAISVQRFGGMFLEGKDMGLEIIDKSCLLLPQVLINDGIDMCIASWILWPDEERSSTPNLEKEVKKRLSSEAAAAAKQSGRWKNQMRRAAHNGCCLRVAQTRALCSALWKLLISEKLIEVFTYIETPLVNVLAEMELWGIRINMEGCLWAQNVLAKKLRCLEKEAYKLAGMTFSLYTAADIANVLYGHLKLPVPEGHNKGKQHPRTDKHCLDLLRDEHPIIPVIREHRTLAKLLNCTLGSICSLARLSQSAHNYTLHGRWLQTSTATGRLSMEEPNLQCVEHTVEFSLSEDKNGSDAHVDHYKINVRDFFVPTQDNWLLLTADYSQIELRLMAHFSKDSALIELLSKPQGDVFTMMSAIWTGRAEDSLSSNERDQTKRLIYGILYGMGADTLAKQLKCTSDEAKEKIKSFKRSFPGVASWLREAILSCHQKGYVETLKGRKRFLSKIKFGNSKEKSKAQRQAVNSICQGSAADIIKIAMIKMYYMIVEGVDKIDSGSSISTKFHMLKDRCRILLQVHDELVLEVDPSVIKEAAWLLQMSMENAVSLLVPLRVKLNVGRTWGSLKPFLADQRMEEAVSKC